MARRRSNHLVAVRRSKAVSTSVEEVRQGVFFSGGGWVLSAKRSARQRKWPTIEWGLGWMSTGLRVEAVDLRATQI
jgi:hypothetical protein